MKNKKTLKILALPADSGGCGHYRVRQPMEMITKHTPHEAVAIDKEKDEGLAIAQALLSADIVTYRSGAENSRSDLVRLANTLAEQVGSKQRFHAKWVLDMDDNLELISPYSGHYYELGTEEYYDKNSKTWIYKDGVDGFNLKANRERVATDIAWIKKADMVTVSTKKMAEYVATYNPNVAVLPNAIDFTRWWKIDHRPNTRLRVGWSGGMSHYEDWWSIKDPLNALLRKHRFTLVMVGHDFTALIDPDLRELVEVRPWVSPDAHSYQMMSLCLDIAIIPLANLPFAQYKSNLKYLEMSALGIPSVVTNIPPYSYDIVHKNNALAYRTPKQFSSCLDELLTNTQLRLFIGKNAEEYVRTHYDAAKLAIKWTEAYESNFVLLTDTVGLDTL